MITSLNALRELAAEEVEILVQRKEEVEMAVVRIGGQSFMGGNYWDFTPECHGGFHYELAKLKGRWDSPETLVEVLSAFLKDNGAKVVHVIEQEVGSPTHDPSEV